MDKVRAAFNLTPVGQAANLVGSLIEASNGHEAAALNHFIENSALGTAAGLTTDTIGSVANGINGAITDPNNAGAHLEPTVKDLFANGGTAIAGVAIGEAMSGPSIGEITQSIADGAQSSFEELCEPASEPEQKTISTNFEFEA